MPKHKKRNSSSDSDSGPEDRNPPPAKKSNSSTSKDTSPEGEQGWHLGNKRFLKVREFKGKVFVDIREFYEKDGELLPGKKGISMTAPQWQKLKELVADVDKKLSEL